MFDYASIHGFENIHLRFFEFDSLLKVFVFTLGIMY